MATCSCSNGSQASTTSLQSTQDIVSFNTPIDGVNGNKGVYGFAVNKVDNILEVVTQDPGKNIRLFLQEFTPGEFDHINPTSDLAPIPVFTVISILVSRPSPVIGESWLEAVAISIEVMSSSALYFKERFKLLGLPPTPSIFGSRDIPIAIQQLVASIVSSTDDPACIVAKLKALHQDVVVDWIVNKVGYYYYIQSITCTPGVPGIATGNIEVLFTAKGIFTDEYISLLVEVSLRTLADLSIIPITEDGKPRKYYKAIPLNRVHDVNTSEYTDTRRDLCLKACRAIEKACLDACTNFSGTTAVLCEERCLSLASQCVNSCS
jgi:hypothetical protein